MQHTTDGLSEVARQVVLSHAVSRRGAQSVAQPLVIHQPINGFSQRVGIAWRHQEPILFIDYVVDCAGGTCGDQGLPQCHGMQKDRLTHRDPPIVQRNDDNTGALHQSLILRVWDIVQDSYLRKRNRINHRVLRPNDDGPVTASLSSGSQGGEIPERTSRGNDVAFVGGKVHRQPLFVRQYGHECCFSTRPCKRRLIVFGLT